MTQLPSAQLKEQGMVMFQEGKYEAALKGFETAVTAYEQEGDAHGRAEMLNNIGVIHRVRRKPQAAVIALTEAGEIFSEIGEVDKEAQVMGNLADLYAANKQPEEAARYYSEASARFAEVGDREKQAQILRALSLMRLKQGQWMVAMMHMEESLNVRPRLGPARWLYRGLLRFALGLMGAR